MANSGLPKPLVAMRGISKWFGPNQVLFDVDVDFHAGEVHVLAGENGAGKSTLVRILAGNFSDYGGSIRISGRVVRPTTPQEATALGVAIIYQELSLVPPLSVRDNLFLGHFPSRWGGFVDSHQVEKHAREILGEFGLELDLSRPVEELPIGVQQMVEIAKALSRRAQILIMDEPTSALSASDSERLFDLIERLKARGRAIVYITHRLEEMERLADRITVLRDGHVVGRALRGEIDMDAVVRWMVGRQLAQQFPPRKRPGNVERLRVEGLTVHLGGTGGRPAVRDVHLSANAGEVVGLAGLQGSGVSWVLKGIFDPKSSRATGRIYLDGNPVQIAGPIQALKQGIAYVPSDRKGAGLVLPMSVLANMSMASWSRLAQWGFRRPGKERTLVAQLAQALRLRAPSLRAEVSRLSGGNQQKVVLGKALGITPRVLLLDEPTRGVDVGAKHEIYEMIGQWTEAGMAILLTTSELPELLALSHRILVFHRGEMIAEFSAEEATSELVLAAAMGRLISA